MGEVSQVATREAPGLARLEKLIVRGPLSVLVLCTFCIIASIMLYCTINLLDGNW